MPFAQTRPAVASSPRSAVVRRTASSMSSGVSPTSLPSYLPAKIKASRSIRGAPLRRPTPIRDHLRRTQRRRKYCRSRRQQDTGSAYTSFECHTGGLSPGLQLAFRLQPSCIDGGGICAPLNGLPLILSPTLGGVEFSFSFETLPGKNYVVQFKTHWTILSGKHCSLYRETVTRRRSQIRSRRPAAILRLRAE